MLNNKKLDENVIKQIKNFTFYNLTSEQKLLIEKLIPNEELKKQYKLNGLCQECNQPNTGSSWCQSCNSKHFQEEFKNWTSSNHEIDKFIQKYQLEATNLNEVIEWIPYNQLNKVEYLAKGGFCTVFKAQWFEGRIDCWNPENNTWKRRKICPDWTVVLKNLNNSINIKADFLQEITYHKLLNSDQVVKCYGISQDPITNNYVIVVNYMKDGNLRQYLKNNYIKLSFRSKVFQLQTIAKGLNSIHEQGLIHHDLHSGNILNQIIGDNVLCYIADLGMCRPANEEERESVYGVLPYVAPEFLRGQPYTQASDIYSLGIIAYEIISGFSPYHDIPHDEFLAIKICQGLRPNLNDAQVPQLLKDLIKKCWDANPERRTTTSDLHKTLNDWYREIEDKNDTEFYRQVKEVAKSSEILHLAHCHHKSHPQAICTSRLLDFGNLPELQNSKEINDHFYSTQIDLVEPKQEEQLEVYQEILPK